MKILLYTSILSGGGAERVLCQLANNFCEEHKVTLVAAYKTEHEYSICDAVKKIYIDDSPRNKHSLRQIVRLREIIASIRPNICISFLPQPNYKMILASLFLNTKVIVSVRNDPNKEYSSKISRIICKILYRFADGIVFQTKDAQQWFPKSIRKKSVIIMNQVDKSFFDVQRCNGEYLVSTGRLNKQKNYPLLFRSFSRYVKSHNKEVLRIYGIGELKEELSRLIDELEMQGHIILMGSSSNISDVLIHAKAFVLSSDFEGMPNGLLEAMAVGLPCISTDCPCGGPKMIIEDGVDGLLVPIDDENKMVEALDKILSNKKFAEKIGKNAKIKAKEFRPEKVFTQWEEYLERVSKQ